MNNLAFFTTLLDFSTNSNEKSLFCFYFLSFLHHQEKGFNDRHIITPHLPSLL